MIDGMTVTKACQDDGYLDAKHRDPKMAGNSFGNTGNEKIK